MGDNTMGRVLSWERHIPGGARFYEVHVGADRNLNSFCSQCRRTTDQFDELPMWTTPAFEKEIGGQGEIGILGQFEISTNTEVRLLVESASS